MNCRSSDRFFFIPPRNSSRAHTRRPNARGLKEVMCAHIVIVAGFFREEGTSRKTALTGTRTSKTNGLMHEQTNGFARPLYMLVHVFTPSGKQLEMTRLRVGHTTANLKI